MPFLARLYSHLALLLVLVGGFAVITTFAFAPATADDIDLGVAVAVVVLAAATTCVRLAFVLRAAAAAICLVGAWTVLVTADVFGFSDSTQRWLAFASGLAIVGLSAAGRAIDVQTSGRPAVRPVAHSQAA